MATIRIYHKAGASAPTKPSAATIKAVRERLASGAVRVQRPELVDFLTPSRGGSLSSFYRLPALPAAVIDNRWRRIAEHAEDGWTIPVGSLGRNAEATPSQAQSVLLWIKKNVPELVNPEHVSVVVED